MLRAIATKLIAAITLQVWVIDDVSFPKDGKMSAGVARQWCGALGKRANCQVAVSLHTACDAASVPISWRLFVPKEWEQDTGRRCRAGIPDEVRHCLTNLPSDTPLRRVVRLAKMRQRIEHDYQKMKQ